MTDTITTPNTEQTPKLLTKTEKKQLNAKNARKKATYARVELKRKAKIIAKEVINGATPTSAVVTAGYSPKTNVNQIMHSKEVQRTFNQILEKTGLTDDKIAEKLKSLFNAKETKFFADKGIVTDQREVESNTIQLDTVKTLLKVKGHITDKSVIEVPGIEDILDQIAQRKQVSK